MHVSAHVGWFNSEAMNQSEEKKRRLLRHAWESSHLSLGSPLQHSSQEKIKGSNAMGNVGIYDT